MEAIAQAHDWFRKLASRDDTVDTITEEQFVTILNDLKYPPSDKDEVRVGGWVC